MDLRRTILGGIPTALLIIGLMACSDDGVQPVWPPDVAGIWRWVQSVERATGEVLSPASEGYSAELRLMVDATDRTEGQFEYWMEGERMASGRFGIAFEDTPGNDFIVWDPPFGSFHSQQWLNAWGDTLQMVDATIGGFRVRWAREH